MADATTTGAVNVLRMLRAQALTYSEPPTIRGLGRKAGTFLEKLRAVRALDGARYWAANSRDARLSAIDRAIATLEASDA